jgi:hypothetical protein
MCERHQHERHRHGYRRWSRRMPSREEMLSALEERQRDLEQEIADIHDLLRRLRDETAAPGEPTPTI